MREGIETKPLPLLDIDNIDLMKSTVGAHTPLRTMKTMLPNSHLRRQVKMPGAPSGRSSRRNGKNGTTLKAGRLDRRMSIHVGTGDLEDDERESMYGDGDEDDNFDTRSARSKTMSVVSGVSRTKRAALFIRTANANSKLDNQSIKSSRKERRSPTRKPEEQLPQPVRI